MARNVDITLLHIVLKCCSIFFLAEASWFSYLPAARRVNLWNKKCT